MSIKEGFGKKVTLNMMDGIEQKIDKLTVMMGKLVMEDKGQNRPFKPRLYQSNRGRGQTKYNYDQKDFKIGLDQTVHTEGDQGMDKSIEVGQDMILIIEVAMGIIQEVVRDIGDQIITVIEGETYNRKKIL